MLSTVAFHGYHVYQDYWTPFVGEELICKQEPTNVIDRCAVKVVKDGQTVGHLPKVISRPSSLFLRSGGRVICRVTGGRRYSTDLEIPCTITFTSQQSKIRRLRRVLSSAY